MQGLYSEHPPRATTNIESLSINPFHSDGLSNTYLINKYGMGPFCILSCHMLKFLNFDIFVPEDCFNLSK